MCLEESSNSIALHHYACMHLNFKRWSLSHLANEKIKINKWKKMSYNQIYLPNTCRCIRLYSFRWHFLLLNFYIRLSVMLIHIHMCVLCVCVRIIIYKIKTQCDSGILENRFRSIRWHKQDPQRTFHYMINPLDGYNTQTPIKFV